MDISITEALETSTRTPSALDDEDREAFETWVETHIAENSGGQTTFTHFDMRGMTMLGFIAGRVYQSQFDTGTVSVEMDGDTVSAFLRFLQGGTDE